MVRRLLKLRNQAKRTLFMGAFASLFFTFVSCSDPEPRVYSVAREVVTPGHSGGQTPETMAGMPAMATTSGAIPPVSHEDLHAPVWILPAAWEDYPAEGMRFANFRSKNEDLQQHVTVTVFHFPGPAGGLLGNVNRWRGQLGLPPISDEELAEEGSQMTIAGISMFIVDMIADPADSASQRTMAAMFRHDEESWFVKMEGVQDAVRVNTQNFIDFLSSIKFHP